MFSEVVGSIFWAGAGMGVLLVGGQQDLAPWWAAQLSGILIALVPVVIVLIKRSDRKEIESLKKTVEELKKSIDDD